MQGNPIQQLPLRDIHQPDPVSWWPLSPTWWVLLAGVLALGLLAWWWFNRSKVAKRFTKEALSQLDALNRNFHGHQDLRTHLVDVSIFIRRLLLSHYPNREIAGLRGSRWCDFVNAIISRSSVKNPLFFSEQVFLLMDQANYQKAFNQQAVDLHSLNRAIHMLIHCLAKSKPDREVARV